MAIIMSKNKKEFAFGLYYFTSFGITVVVSFMIWIFIALWLKKTFMLGNFIVIIGIVLGAGSAGMSFYNFWRKTCLLASDKENEDGRK